MSDESSRDRDPASPLPHLTGSGEAHIVDVGEKPATRRVAVAEGWIRLSEAAFAALQAGELKKGDALGTARIAGLMAAKRTADLVPLCHPVALSHAEVTLTPETATHRVECRVRTETTGPTGVEMEALTAVQTALLTVYDMCKGLDRGMEIGGVRLVHKRGGRSGHWGDDPG
ncbi:cyclic pyranopterin monophosphate synthase MoaC [Halorhodospira halophila]|uniref:Cyclic pyranopterin monophosphate synthase n=1 Tax=Halorhodospira halophila (strain DSM 244 / SL1) TaxID=349124 RepID=A1WWH8_HALHL|nr:cyclic pyranopterin monophosphate synthase MoaC [Halorhodospira halophila]ABM62040.1 GTP cyclohydrolase subunit MoaC [Halorhodospira halophila SL1]MBK1728419.1 cyclic pyranopterin monophosphate synthase MoaC [Halorhodospira halophila]